MKKLNKTVKKDLCQVFQKNWSKSYLYDNCNNVTGVVFENGDDSIYMDFFGNFIGHIDLYFKNIKNSVIADFYNSENFKEIPVAVRNCNYDVKMKYFNKLFEYFDI